MRRRMIGATLTVLGVMVVLIEPFRFGRPCPDFISGGAGYCRDQGSFSLWGWVEYPQGWDWLAWPMLIIGVALVVTGIVLLIKARRSRGSPSTAR
jgi:hypothetical protein